MLNVRGTIIIKTLPYIQSILAAVILVVILNYILNISYEYLSEHHREKFISLLPAINILLLLFFVLSGFVAAVILNKNHIIIGLIAGIFSGVLVDIIYSDACNLTLLIIHNQKCDLFELLTTFLKTMLLGGIGGSLSLFLSKYTNKNL